MSEFLAVSAMKSCLVVKAVPGRKGRPYASVHISHRADTSMILIPCDAVCCILVSFVGQWADILRGKEKRPRASMACVTWAMLVSGITD